MKYSSQDMYLAAFLAAQGQPVVHWQRVAGMTTFAFEQNAELSQLVEAYYSDRATISPIQFGNSLKTLKSLIHTKHYGQFTFAQQYGSNSR